MYNSTLIFKSFGCIIHLYDLVKVQMLYNTSNIFLNAKVIIEKDKGHYDSNKKIQFLLNEILKINSKTI